MIKCKRKEESLYTNIQQRAKETRKEKDKWNIECKRNKKREKQMKYRVQKKQEKRKTNEISSAKETRKEKDKWNIECKQNKKGERQI